MRYLIPLSFLFGATLADSLSQSQSHDDNDVEGFRRRKSSPSAITITWEKSISGDVATTAWDATGETLYNFNCGNTVTVGNETYTYVLDNTGSGFLLYGGMEFMVQPEGEGIACTREWNNDFAMTQCEVPIPDGIDAIVPSPHDSELECFPNSGTAASFRFQPRGDVLPIGGWNITNLSILNETKPVLPEPPARLRNRKRCIPFWVELNHPNRHPTKWGMHKQVTPTHNCGTAPGCEISYQNGHSVEFTAEVFGGGPWFGGGFSVTWGTNWGWSATCAANPRQSVCVWTWQRYQDYNIRYMSSCNSFDPGPFDARARSPMSAGHHFGTYCVIGTCRGNGQSYWISEGDGRW